MGFVEKFDLWTEQQKDSARRASARVAENDVRSVRLSFVDQHGLLRGKTIAAAGLDAAFRDGVPVVSTLLSKDTSGATVFPAFNADGGVGIADMAGAADVVMVPDPNTYRELPWSAGTAWVLCDLRFRSGAPVPFCSRGQLRAALERAAGMGFEYVAGLEVEFHVFRRANHDPNGDGIGRHERPTAVEPINHGGQLLAEHLGDELEPITHRIRDNLAGAGVELRTVEVEFGANQVEVTLAPAAGLAPADGMVLLRSAIKQVMRRAGYHATFMCRPQVLDSKASGWHLHQSLLGTGAGGGGNVFVPGDADGDLSPTGRAFVAGQLHHARGACVFSTPTVNGYKRYLPYSMAPDRIAWARDNRGAMIRLVGTPEDGTTHIENRVGEPAANPYLYMASQLHAGLNGVDAGLELGRSADDPYSGDAERLPGTLREAITALEADTGLADAMGRGFVEYYAAIKKAEVDRFERAVTDWEQREYFDLY